MKLYWSPRSRSFTTLWLMEETGEPYERVLTDISTNLRSGNSTALNGDLTKMDTAISQISSAQATEGASYQRVQVAQSVQSSNGLSLQTELSSIQDIDLADMAVKVSTASVTYQASLQTTASIQQLSLLNFLN